jgi:hypothetical protein
MRIALLRRGVLATGQAILCCWGAYALSLGRERSFAYCLAWS